MKYIGSCLVEKQKLKELIAEHKTDSSPFRDWQLGTFKKKSIAIGRKEKSLS